MGKKMIILLVAAILLAGGLAVACLFIATDSNCTPEEELCRKSAHCDKCGRVHLTPATGTGEYQRLFKACTITVAKRLDHNKKVLADHKKKVAAGKKEKASLEVTAREVLGPQDKDSGIFYTSFQNPASRARSSYDSTYTSCTLSTAIKKGVCKLTSKCSEERLEVNIEANGGMPNIIMLVTDPFGLEQKDGGWNEAHHAFLSQFQSDAFGRRMLASGLRSFFKLTFSSEMALRLSGWLLDNDTMWKNLGGKRKALAKAWLPKFYRASKMDYPALLAKVKAWDDTPDDKRPTNLRGELFRSKYPELIVELHFLRTWLRDGGEHQSTRANELMAVRRFWMVMLAYKVKHSQADTWAAEVLIELQGTSTLWFRSWYISTLSQKKMPPPPKDNSLYVEPPKTPDAGSGSSPDASQPPDSGSSASPDAGPPKPDTGSKSSTW